MREAKVRVFDYSELSEKAKDRAFEDFLSSDFGDFQFSMDENRATLDAFEKIFPIRIKDWDVGWGNYINFGFTGCDDEEDLCGIRLAAHLWTHYKDDLYKGKYYSKTKVIDGKYITKSRHSRVILDNSCVLTGMCMDDEILGPIYRFMEKPSAYANFRDLMQDCLDAWVTACAKEYEYYQSREYFEESYAHEWEYEESGKKWLVDEVK